jgi:ABC-2 type transport system permease protein
VTVSQYPESIFGPALRAVLYGLLPAGLVGWLPVALLRDFTWTGLGTLVAATTALAAVAVFVFHRGLIRYASGSRVRAGI